jgi:hypothetical protein
MPEIALVRINGFENPKILPKDQPSIARDHQDSQINDDLFSQDQAGDDQNRWIGHDPDIMDALAECCHNGEHDRQYQCNDAS